MDKLRSILHRAYDLYADGFRQMTIGRTLWAVILIKLFIIFAVLKIFFSRTSSRPMRLTAKRPISSRQRCSAAMRPGLPNSVSCQITIHSPADNNKSKQI